LILILRAHVLRVLMQRLLPGQWSKPGGGDQVKTSQPARAGLNRERDFLFTAGEAGKVELADQIFEMTPKPSPPAAVAEKQRFPSNSVGLHPIAAERFPGLLYEV
jgi:hypothetical protein